MANARFKELLAQGADQWADENVENAPSGIYVMQLQDASLFETQDRDGNDVVKVKWEHLVREGEYKGETVVDFSSPMSPKAFARKLLRERIRRLGFDPSEDIRDLEETVAAIANAAQVYRAKLVWKNGFANVTVQQVIEDAAPAPKAAPKSTPKAAPAASAESTDGLAIGAQVRFAVEDGAEVVGTVTGRTGKEYTIEDSDGNQYTGEAADFRSESASAGATDDANRLALLEFAQTMEVDVTEDDTEDILRAVLSEHEWVADNITPDEAALLKANDITVKSAKPKPARQKVKRGGKRKA